MREENTHKQKKAPDPVKISPNAFGPRENTAVYWLGNGGAMINARGVCIMIDPLLEGFDMPLLVDAPITPEETGELSAVLITHCDNDHLSRATCGKLKEKCRQFCGPHYVAGLLEEEGIPASGYDIGAEFSVGDVQVTLTPADHAWQNESKKHAAGRLLWILFKNSGWDNLDAGRFKAYGRTASSACAGCNSDGLLGQPVAHRAGRCSDTVRSLPGGSFDPDTLGLRGRSRYAGIQRGSGRVEKTDHKSGTASCYGARETIYPGVTAQLWAAVREKMHPE